MPETTAQTGTEGQKWTATGKRKAAIARVILKPGTGVVTVNRRSIEDYFGGRKALGMIVAQPLDLAEARTKFDIWVNVRGGGPAGQASAVRHGITKALLQVNSEWRIPLKRAGYITRDSRIVERKKYGQAGARKRFQYSKR